MTPIFMVLLAFAARSSAPPPPPLPNAPWKAVAECSAAYYADASIPDLKRTRPLLDDLKDNGRRYAAEALAQQRKETGWGQERSRAFTKTYIMERTRLLALRTRPEVRAIIDACPKL